MPRRLLAARIAGDLVHIYSSVPLESLRHFLRPRAPPLCSAPVTVAASFSVSVASPAKNNVSSSGAARALARVTSPNSKVAVGAAGKRIGLPIVQVGGPPARTRSAAVRQTRSTGFPRPVRQCAAFHSWTSAPPWDRQSRAVIKGARNGSEVQNVGNAVVAEWKNAAPWYLPPSSSSQKALRNRKTQLQHRPERQSLQRRSFGIECRRETNGAGRIEGALAGLPTAESR